MVREPPKVRKWSGDSTGDSKVIGRPYRRIGSGRETLPEDQKWSGDPPEGLEVVVRPSLRYDSGRETLPEI